MASHEECAYCIWHPETATEETYRRLARKYPQLRYQVGRACAIAGYKKLYSELDLLSDISIAEEARESGGADISGSADIYRMIIAQSPFYEVLDDYTRTVNLDDPKEVTGINCDTAVRSSLDIKQPLTDLTLPLTGDLFCDDEEPRPIYTSGFRQQMFNITEDQSIDDHETEDTRQFDDHTSLLYSPLPKHLPNVKKNLLINAAASKGNVDRYCRLRRPFGKMGGSHEIPALVRGVYHHPFFAKWCSLQPEFLKCEEIQNAITARYIMSNDVSRVTAETNVCQIWYPSWASSDTYREVLRRAPVTMRDTIARAAIVTDHYSLFDAADPDPSNIYIGIEAIESPNPYYYQALRTKAEDQEKIFMDERASEFSRLNVSTTR
ncbi:hypothetical protein B9Z65_5136 [Elsinoe australis]|uniref:Uncharacterized protein n=1 Tax=Elsinoe australis TaxID=40998 RepID=A0A2P7ZD91_9PEZI|nr:hypothetical protein B9Z65_5136 [Elsinoe australis]